jgi:salicylate hydroxylase
MESKRRLIRDGHMNIHRAPLQKVLVEAATEAGVEILVNAKVVKIDKSASPSAITKDGRRFNADLIIGADGRFDLAIL